VGANDPNASIASHLELRILGRGGKCAGKPLEVERRVGPSDRELLAAAVWQGEELRQLLSRDHPRRAVPAEAHPARHGSAHIVEYGLELLGPDCSLLDVNREGDRLPRETGQGRDDGRLCRLQVDLRPVACGLQARGEAVQRNRGALRPLVDGRRNSPELELQAGLVHIGLRLHPGS
jgi:hypothetical protein